MRPLTLHARLLTSLVLNPFSFVEFCCPLFNLFPPRNIPFLSQSKSPRPDEPIVFPPFGILKLYAQYFLLPDSRQFFELDKVTPLPSLSFPPPVFFLYLFSLVLSFSNQESSVLPLSFLVLASRHQLILKTHVSVVAFLSVRIPFQMLSLFRSLNFSPWTPTPPLYPLRKFYRFNIHMLLLPPAYVMLVFLRR